MVRRLLLPLGLLLALAAACGGDSAQHLKAKEAGQADLALMVLSLAELGPQYEELILDEALSGFRSNEVEAASAFDPEDEARDARRFGRVNGYRGAYSPRNGLAAGEALFLVSTTVVLYESDGGASRNLRDTLEDAMRAVGSSQQGVTLEEAREFAVEGIGEEAIGIVLIVRVSQPEGTTAQGTNVAFRQGRFFGVVSIGRFDDADVRGEAAALAQKLDERIAAVLRGEVGTGARR